MSTKEPRGFFRRLQAIEQGAKPRPTGTLKPRPPAALPARPPVRRTTGQIIALVAAFLVLIYAVLRLFFPSA